MSQSLTLPQFLNLDAMLAAHRHGMLELTLPLKDSVKPRRIQIDDVTKRDEEAANHRIACKRQDGDAAGPVTAGGKQCPALD
jgi:hypothetical protein